MQVAQSIDLLEIYSDPEMKMAPYRAHDLVGLEPIPSCRDRMSLVREASLLLVIPSDQIVQLSRKEFHLRSAKHFLHQRPPNTLTSLGSEMMFPEPRMALHAVIIVRLRMRKRTELKRITMPSYHEPHIGREPPLEGRVPLRRENRYKSKTQMLR